MGTGADDDQITTNGWRHNKSNALKDATKIFYNKNRVIMHVHPHLDAFRTGRLLVPPVEIKLELFCNAPDVFLFGDKSMSKRSITVTDADLNVKLYLCHLSLNTSMYNTLKAKCQVIGQLARYPVVRSKIHTFAFTGDTTKFQKDDVFVGEMPDRMFVGLLDSRGLNGDFEYYPFCFPEIRSDQETDKSSSQKRIRLQHWNGM